MAIDSITGEEEIVTTGEPPEEATPITALEGTSDFQLSDQSEAIQGGQEALQGVADTAIGQIGSVEADEVDYVGTDAEELKEGAAIDEGSSYITPEGTVSGQLESLLNSESAYMKTAERRAKEQAASLGLLGSSMAVGAAQRAAIESALPIAEADAKTYAQSQLAEQAAYNEISKNKAESDLSAVAREHIYDIDVAKASTQATFNQIAENAKMQGNIVMETTLSQIKNQWDAEVKTSLANLDAKLQSQLKAQEISAKEREYASTTSSQIMAAAYGTINDLVGNADFMAGYADDPEGLQAVFNNFIDLAKNQVEFIGATAGLGDEYFQDGGYADLIGSWTANLEGYTPVEDT